MFVITINIIKYYLNYNLNPNALRWFPILWLLVSEILCALTFRDNLLFATIQTVFCQWWWFLVKKLMNILPLLLFLILKFAMPPNNFLQYAEKMTLFHFLDFRFRIWYKTMELLIFFMLKVAPQQWIKEFQQARIDYQRLCEIFSQFFQICWYPYLKIYWFIDFIYVYILISLT